MASQVDFSIAVGLFFTFIAMLMLYLVNYISSYTGVASTSELRTVAYNVYKVLFSGAGIPSDWERRGYAPVKVGLVTDLYRLPIKLAEINATARNNITINISVSFDNGCTNKSWNNSIRVYDPNNVQLPVQLYNQSFCSDQYLNSSDLVINLSLAANQIKYVFVYFSPEQSIQPANYGLEYPVNLTNITTKQLPEEKLISISPGKLNALKSLNYDQVLKTVGTDYKFRIEIESIE